MSGFLDNDQIEHLVESAREGNLPAAGDPAAGRRARWLRTVDFTRPTKFSTDQERRIRRALETFGPAAATRLIAEHRVGIEFEIIDVGQFTWANAFAEVPESSVHVTIEGDPHEGRMLLSAERRLMVLALERLLGGKPETVRADRPLTDIDLMLVRRLMSTIVESLSAVWFDISEVALRIGAVDTAAEMVQVAGGSEPTLALTLEVRLEGQSSTMTLLVPYTAIAPVASHFSRHDEEEVRRDARSVAAVQHGLSLVDVSLRAEVADTTLSLEDVVALQPGDIVRLDADADAEVTLYADRTPVHRGRAGRSGTRRAVQVTTSVEVTP
jgi:flagellar motor switch protein FliM